MAKRNRFNRNFGVIPYREGIALSTLAASAAITGTAPVLTQDFRTISMDCVWSQRDLTSGEGPVLVGWAAPELTVAEIAEAISAAPTSQYDYPAIEHSRRPVRKAGSFPVVLAGEVLNDGKAIRTKMRMDIPAGKGMPQAFTFNDSGNVLTTGGVTQVEAKYYGVWK